MYDIDCQMKTQLKHSMGKRFTIFLGKNEKLLQVSIKKTCSTPPDKYFKES